MLIDVIQELKTLREEVKDLKERSHPISSNQENPDVGLRTTYASVQPQSAEPLATTSSCSPSTNQLPTTNQLPIATAQVPSSSLPLVDIVPEHIRQDIIRGKDINLVQLLLPTRERGIFASSRAIKIGDETLHLKPLSDKRLVKQLTVQEFVKAFNIYKNVLCESFPNRREEMDSYMSSIIHIGTKYPGFAHYEYHLEFSARAAYYKEHHNTLIDWGIIDDRLLTQIVAGRRANTCALCGGYDHTTSLCELTEDGKKTKETPKLCSFYNSPRGCRNASCTYTHACSICKKSGHVRDKCGMKQKSASD